MNHPLPLRFHHYRPAAWLRISGQDAAAFLQGQFTNELRDAGPAGVYGLWLDVKGKTLADSFIVPGDAPGAFWLASYFCAGEAIRRRLEEYIIADDVVVEDLTSEWAGLSVLGEGADIWREGQAPRGGIRFGGRRASAPSWECVYPLTAADSVAGVVAGSAELGADDMARLRISAGIPAVPRDLGPGDLPNEGGLESAAISYTKGCYLGQEIMARLKSRGKLRRRLTRVQGAGLFPSLPAPLWQAGKPVGELRSAVADGRAGFIGLAMLTHAGLNPAQLLSFAASGPPEIAIGNSY